MHDLLIQVYLFSYRVHYQGLAILPPCSCHFTFPRKDELETWPKKFWNRGRKRQAENQESCTAETSVMIIFSLKKIWNWISVKGPFTLFNWRCKKLQSRRFGRFHFLGSRESPLVQAILCTSENPRFQLACKKVIRPKTRRKIWLSILDWCIILTTSNIQFTLAGTYWRPDWWPGRGYIKRRSR